MRALVTGGNSFIGTHLIDALVKKGVKVSVLVRNRKDTKTNFNGDIKLYVGDLSDKASLSSICDDHDIDVVFHLASSVHKMSKTEEEKKYVLKVNVDGTRNLLDSLSSSVKHIIFFSSVSVYGINSGFNIDEMAKTDPVTIYGITKLRAESIIRDWGKGKNVKTTSLRLPLVYGPGNKGNIYKIIESIDRRRFVMIGKGENKRSLVYVGNVVDAALAVVGKREADGKVFIVTDGVDYTVRNLCETIAKGLQKKSLLLYIPMSIAKGVAWIGDTVENFIGKPLPFNSEVLGKLANPLTFSSHKIQAEIGFKPYYNLHNTINETMKWYKSRRCEKKHL